MSRVGETVKMNTGYKVTAKGRMRGQRGKEIH